VSIGSAGSAPSPLILQIEAALSAGSIIEPRSANAWDLYQRLNQDPAAASEVARLKPRLAQALVKAGREIVLGDIRGDNITEKVDEFRRAGQMFSRARTLAPEDQSLAVLEKLSAAEALISLQFYEEAERSLTALQAAQMAAVENALGLAYHGRAENYRAERALKRAIELDAKWAAPHYNLALVYRSQSNDAAVDELSKAAELDPQNSVILSALGDEYFNREKWQQAADTFKKAIALSPNDDTLYTRLGHALFSLGQRQEADLAYKKANELRKR
jgi:tetratricopeptide (TPR) repeat protein